MSKKAWAAGTVTAFILGIGATAGWVIHKSDQYEKEHSKQSLLEQAFSEAKNDLTRALRGDFPSAAEIQAKSYEAEAKSIINAPLIGKLPDGIKHYTETGLTRALMMKDELRKNEPPSAKLEHIKRELREGRLPEPKGGLWADYNDWIGKGEHPSPLRKINSQVQVLEKKAKAWWQNLTQ